MVSVSISYCFLLAFGKLRDSILVAASHYSLIFQKRRMKGGIYNENGHLS